MGLTPGLVRWLLGLIVVLGPLGSGLITLAQPMPPISLECRLGEGPWQKCQMVVIQLGRHWFLQIGQGRLEFVHDGTGTVRMKKGGLWVEVEPKWAGDQTLCWGNVCARGEIPLD